MSKRFGVGVIGCGNISQSYMELAPLFRGIEIRSCADLNPEIARIRARDYDLRAETVDRLLQADDIDIIVNLTIPASHYEVSRAALEAGKHVYSEKPLVLDLEQGLELQALAEEKSLRIGSAPDTFLGGAHQYARSLVDSGGLGEITSGTCHVMSHGMEHWHPDPKFFFKPGGGPILDMGPYYLVNLIQLIGPAKRVAALTSIPVHERTVTSKTRNGEKITVATPTTVHALIEFANGAVITLGASWDVWKNGHAPMELYGSEGTLLVPDPNFFGGLVQYSARDADYADGPVAWDHPFGVGNRDLSDGCVVADYRSCGLADMALAIGERRPHRCALENALHGVEIMTAILKSGETGCFIELKTSCERPAALEPDNARDMLCDG